MNLSSIFGTLRHGPKELQKLAILILDTFYRTKKTLLSNDNKNIEFYLNKLNKELRLNKQKTILQYLDMLIKLFNNIEFVNEFILKDQKISLKKQILKTIKDYERRINLIHQENIHRKLRKVKSFIMATVTLKFKTNLLKGIEILIDVRKAVKNSCREFLRYKGKEFDYLIVPEISKTGLLHFHMYLYEELSEEEMEKLQKTLERRINKLGKVKDFDVQIQDMDLIYDNYSSSSNNIFNKMAGEIRARQIIYYLFIKMFGRRRFLTHSRMEISFTKLKTIMKLFGRGGVFNVTKISYFKLVEIIRKKSAFIQIKVGFISLYDFIKKELEFIRIVSRIKVDDTILRLQMIF